MTYPRIPRLRVEACRHVDIKQWQKGELFLDGARDRAAPTLRGIIYDILNRSGLKNPNAAASESRQEAQEIADLFARSPCGGGHFGNLEVREFWQLLRKATLLIMRPIGHIHLQPRETN